MKFSHIIHIADLHIRSGDTNKSRFHEYNTVFKRLIEDLSTFTPILEKKTIILIAGDIFHDKLKIESCGLQLINTFLQSLSALAPIVVIRGNHDYRQEFPNEPDLIQSLLYNPIQNVHYWNQDGHYTLGNIGFGLVSIQNALMSGNTSGIATELPNFPDPTFFDDNELIDHTIALFHGPIGKTKLQNGTNVLKHHSYPLEWFKGYDSILLGDIHLQQVHNCSPCEPSQEFNHKQFIHSTLVEKYKWTSKQPWAYPGSLIQQTFGEGLTSHGFLIWNLEEKTTLCFHIKNDFGYVYVKKNYHDGNILLKHNMKWINILDIITTLWFPSQCQIRIVATDNNDMMVIDEIRQLFNKFDKHITNIMHYLVNNDNDNHEEESDIEQQLLTSSNSVDISSFNTPNTWAEFINKTVSTPIKYNEWNSWFENFETLQVPLPPTSATFGQEVIKRNSKIQVEILGLQNSLDLTSNFVKSKRKTFTINFIEFENILCFKGKNYFDFDHKNTKALISIIAPNGCGKTSFLETICIALYGEDLPSRNSTTNSAAIINKHKMIEDPAQTNIYLTVAEKKYKIKRAFTTQSNDKNNIRCQSSNVNVHEYDESTKSYQYLCSGSGMVNKWVEENIGPYQAFLLSGLISQNGDMDFFQLSSIKQRSLLDAALHLGSTTCFQGLLKESKLAHNAILDTCKTLMTSFGNKEFDLPKVEQDIISISQQISTLQNEKDTTIKTYHSLNDKAQNINNFTNLFKMGKTTLIDKIKEYDAQLQNIEEDIIVLKPLSIANDIGKLQFELQAIDLSKITPLIDPDYYHDENGKIENKITSLKQDLSNISNPTYSLDEISKIESEFSILKSKVDGRDIYHIYHIIKQNSQQLINDDISLQKLYDQRKQYQNDISVNKIALDTHVSNRPMDIRSTMDEYNTWKANVATMENQYSSLQHLQSLFDELISKQIPCPHQDFDTISKNYEETKNTIVKECELYDIDSQIQKISKLTLSLQSSYHDILKKQPPPPQKSHEDFDKWNSNIKLFHHKYNNNGIEWLQKHLDEINSLKPDIPHTSLEQLLNNKTILSKQISKDCSIGTQASLEQEQKDAMEIQKHIVSIQNDLDNINLTYISHLSNKPQQPIKYTNINDFQEAFSKYNSEKESMMKLLEANKNMPLDIQLSKNILISLEQLVPSLQNISSQHDEYVSMLAEIQEHPFNPECWACQKQPWKIQQDSIQAKINSLNSSIKDHGKKIKAISGKFKPSTFIANLKIHISLLEKYFDMVKDESFWKDENEKILDYINWEQKGKSLSSNIQQFQSAIQKEKSDFSSVNDLIINIKNNIQLDECIDMINSWNSFNAWQDSWRIIYDDYVHWSSLLELKDFWMEDNNRRNLHNQWKYEVLGLENHIYINKSLLDTLQNDKQIIIIRKLFKELNEYNLWKLKHDQLENHLSTWKELESKNEFWNEESKRSKALTEWKVLWEEMKDDLENKYNLLSSLDNDVDKLSKNNDKLKQIISDLEDYEKQYQSLQTKMRVVENDRNIYSERDALDMIIKTYSQYLKAIWLKEEISQLQSYLDDINTYNNIQEVYKHYQDTLSIWDEWNNILDDYDNIKVVEANIQELNIKKALLMKQCEEHQDNLNNKKSLQEYINIISERYEGLCSIYESFGLFKKWIYENKVMPFLQNTANNIINKISIARPIYIKSDIHSDSTGALQFTWSIQDGKTIIPIQKASGFQKNMASFAIRIALCQIGATSIKPSQIFIDEGFTSCDNDNRSRVGELLLDLLANAQYQQLVIVTHLEDINAFANTYVHIKRTNDDASILQYGTPMVPVKVARRKNVKL
jgi:DNA repair exonuclease SbcCD ATPase subunit